MFTQNEIKVYNFYMTRHMTPYECVVEAFGSHELVAEVAGYERSVSIYQWGYRKGSVPIVPQRILLKYAEENGLDLTARDLILGRDVE